MPKELIILLVAFHFPEQTQNAVQDMNGSGLRNGKKAKTKDTSQP